MPDQDHGVTVPTNRKTAPDRPLTGRQAGLPREQGYENKAHHVCTGHGGLLTNTIGWQSEKRETARARVGDSPEAQGTKRSKKSFLCPCRSTRMASPAKSMMGGGEKTEKLAKHRQQRGQNPRRVH